MDISNPETSTTVTTTATPPTTPPATTETPPTTPPETTTTPPATTPPATTPPATTTTATPPETPATEPTTTSATDTALSTTVTEPTAPVPTTDPSSYNDFEDLGLGYEYVEKETDPKLQYAQNQFLKIVKPKNDFIKEKMNIYHGWIKSQVGPDNKDELRQKIFANTYVYKELRVQTRMLIVFNVVCIIIIFLSMIHHPYFDKMAYGGIVGTLIALLFVYQLFYAWDLWIRDTHNFDEYDFSHFGKGVSSLKENDTDKLPEPGCIERIGIDAVNKNFMDTYMNINV